MKPLFFSFFLLPIGALLASDYGFVEEQNPWNYPSRLDRVRPWNAEVGARGVAAAKFTSPGVTGSKVHYADGYTDLYYSWFFSKENSLSAQVGYNVLKFQWDANPRFHRNYFEYAETSLAWVNKSFHRWRWLVNAGVSVDTRSFNFGQTGLYTGILWGRYAALENLGLHIGACGYQGIKNHYYLPVAGLDWAITRQFRVIAVFPLNYSLIYYLDYHWKLELSYASFGGPYKSPRRLVGGTGPFANGIFSVYAQGADLDLSYKSSQYLTVGAGFGWNFGGWILIKNSQNQDKAYYKYNGAPYARLFLSLAF